MNSNVVQLPEELPKGEKNRLESWPFRGQPLVSSRLRQRQVVGEPEEESEDSEHAPLAELREAKKLEQEDEFEEQLGGYDYNVLSDSLTLMSSMGDEYDDITLFVEGTEGSRVEGKSGGTWPYKEAVGGLMWLVVMSRPNINAVRALSRHSNSPAERHLKAVLQIIRYLSGTKDLSLTFEWGSILEISVFADANYAEKADDRRSVSGVALTVGKSSVSWFSSTQKIVTFSTTEAEYVALGDGVKEALFVKGVLSFIIPPISENSIKVLVDNDGAISPANNSLSPARTKHIDVRFHFIRELTTSKTISVEYVPTKEQRADILTKALAGAIFKEHRDFLMNLHE